MSAANREKWELDLKTDILRKAQEYENIQVMYVAALQQRVGSLRKELFQCYEELLRKYSEECEDSGNILRKYRDLYANGERCVLLLEKINEQIEKKTQDIERVQQSAILSVVPLSKRPQFYNRAEQQRAQFLASLSPTQRREFLRLTNQ